MENLMSKKLIVIGSWFGVSEVFKNLYSEIVHINNLIDLEENAKHIDSSSTILYGGGQDISPSFYNQKALPVTGAYDYLSKRDDFEYEVFKIAIEAGANFIGVCRGAQLLCALAGGSLYQHVDFHAGGQHPMTTKEGTVLNVSSAHHQMMNPEGTEHELLAWSSDVRSPRHIVERENEAVNLKVDTEPEVVFFNKIKALAIQYHPEFMEFKAPAVKYSRELVSKYLIGG